MRENLNEYMKDIQKNEPNKKRPVDIKELKSKRITLNLELQKSFKTDTHEELNLIISNLLQRPLDPLKLAMPFLCQTPLQNSKKKKTCHNSLPLYWNGGRATLPPSSLYTPGKEIPKTSKKWIQIGRTQHHRIRSRYIVARRSSYIVATILNNFFLHRTTDPMIKPCRATIHRAVNLWSPFLTYTLVICFLPKD